MACCGVLPVPLPLHDARQECSPATHHSVRSCSKKRKRPTQECTVHVHLPPSPRHWACSLDRGPPAYEEKENNLPDVPTTKRIKESAKSSISRTLFQNHKRRQSEVCVIGDAMLVYRQIAQKKFIRAFAYRRHLDDPQRIPPECKGCGKKTCIRCSLSYVAVLRTVQGSTSLEEARKRRTKRRIDDMFSLEGKGAQEKICRMHSFGRKKKKMAATLSTIVEGDTTADVIEEKSNANLN